MSDFDNDITTINIEDELKQSYLDYAMSVIVVVRCPMFETVSNPFTGGYCLP